MQRWSRQFGSTAAVCESKRGSNVQQWAKNHIEVARLLLSAKASVDHHDGSTPLLLASFFDHREVVRLLLSANASVDKAKKDGMTPLCYASRDGRTEMASVLLAANASVDLKTPPLVLGCQEGHLDVVELLLSAGAGLNERA